MQPSLALEAAAPPAATGPAPAAALAAPLAATAPPPSTELSAALALAHEAVYDGNEVLVFCATKAKVRALADAVARHLAERAPAVVVSQPASCERARLLDRLIDCGPMRAMRELYKRIVPLGVGLHHAGLGLEEKRAIEEAFRNRTLKVLCATTTLAAGVNLPARRVILPEPTDQAGAFLQPNQYRQMAGRAGRAGLNDLGEVYLVVKDDGQRAKARELMASPMANLTSCLLARKPPPPPPPLPPPAVPQGGVAIFSHPLLWVCPNACQRFTLEAVASGLASTAAQLEAISQQTFAAALCGWGQPASRRSRAAMPPTQASGVQSSAAVASARVTPQAEARAAMEAALKANLNDACNWLRRPSVDWCSTAQQSQQQRRPFLECVRGADEPRWAPTREGKAVHLGCLKPEDAVLLLQSLREVLSCFSSSSTLHIMILLTPWAEADRHYNTMTWQRLSRKLDMLTSSERVRACLTSNAAPPSRASSLDPHGPLASSRCGPLTPNTWCECPWRGQSLLESRGYVNADWLWQRADENAPPRSSGARGRELHMSRMHQRTLDALMLRDLYRGNEIDEVAEWYAIDLGKVQQLQTAAAQYTSQVRTFCEEVGWSDPASLIAAFQERIEFGAGLPDLKPLLSLPFVKLPRAQALYKAGLRTLEQLVAAEASVLVRALRGAPGASLEEPLLKAHVREQPPKPTPNPSDPPVGLVDSLSDPQPHPHPHPNPDPGPGPNPNPNPDPNPAPNPSPRRLALPASRCLCVCVWGGPYPRSECDRPCRVAGRHRRSKRRRRSACRRSATSSSSWVATV